MNIEKMMAKTHWRNWRHRASSIALLALPFVTGACLQASPSMSLGIAPFPLEGPCPQEAQSGEYNDEITTLRVLVDGPDLAEPFEAAGALNGITIEGVPAGEDRTVVIYGDSASVPGVWRGVRTNVTIESGTDNPLDILLARVADLSCTRTPQNDSRAFHTATVLQDGRILLVGGANEDRDASATCDGCSRLTATGSAELYDPTKGTFTPVGQLENPRMFHTATLMNDGRVAIVGGVSEALTVPVSDASPFPIQVRNNAIAQVEVFNLESLAFTTAFEDPNGGRAFHAAALNADGALVISGGIPSQPTAGDLSNASNTVTLCDGELTTCLNSQAMTFARAGHGMFTLPTGDVLIWGGSVSDQANGYSPELFASSDASIQVLDVAGFRSSALNVFFAAHSQYVDFRVLAAGGLVRTNGGGFELSQINENGTARGATYIFDANGEDTSSWLLSAGRDGQAKLSIESPRFFASAQHLPDRRRAVIAGGFNTLSFAPSAALDLFDEDELSISPVTVAGVPVTLREARGALVAVGTGDGTILLSGGETLVDSRRTPLTTGEIFQDPKDPLAGAQ